MRIVICVYSGAAMRKSFTYCTSGASRSTRPRSTRIIVAIAATILLTEPMPNIVSVLGAMPRALSIVPNASAQMMRSPSTNAAEIDDIADSAIAVVIASRAAAIVASYVGLGSARAARTAEKQIRRQ